MTDRSDKGGKPGAAKASRLERLEAELRANLKRRKDQARLRDGRQGAGEGRAAAVGPDGAPEDPDGT